MNDLSIDRPRLWTYLWVCGVAMALGWGIRGQFGHERGAMIPGVMSALAVALISPDDAKRNRFAALGVAGGLGMAIGGSMSYGSIAGSLGDPGFAGVCTVLLAFKGAIWGGFAGAIFGMALSPISYRLRDLICILPLIAFYELMCYLHPGSELSRHDNSWALFYSLILFLLWLWKVKKDRAALLLAVCSMIGFGFGFPFGSWLCVWGNRTAIHVDWWKVAEMTWGLCGGLSWGLAAYVLDEDLVKPPQVTWNRLTALGLIYIAWVTPFWNGYNVVEYWVRERSVLPPSSTAAYILLTVLILAAGIALFRKHPPGPTLCTTAVLLLWVAWSTAIFQFFKMGIPDGMHGSGFWCTQIAFALCGASLTAYAFRRCLAP